MPELFSPVKQASLAKRGACGLQVSAVRVANKPKTCSRPRCACVARFTEALGGKGMELA